MGKSLATQNIERDIAMASSMTGSRPRIQNVASAGTAGSALLPPISQSMSKPPPLWPKSLVLSNIQAVSNRLRLEVATPPLTFTRIAVEQVSIHRLYCGAPGSSESALQINIDHQQGTGTTLVTSRIPYGSFTSAELASVLEININGASHSKIKREISDRAIGKMVLFHSEGAPDISSASVRASTVFVESTTSTHIPMDELLRAVKEQPVENTQVLVVQKVPPATVPELLTGGFAVTRMNGMAEFASVDRPCLSIMGVQATMSQTYHPDPTTSEHLDYSVIKSCNVENLPTEQRGDFDYICQFKYSSFISAIPLRAVLAMAACRNALLDSSTRKIRVHLCEDLEELEPNRPSYARVVGTRTDRDPEICPSGIYCKLFILDESSTHDQTTATQFFGRPSGIPRSIGLENTKCMFKIYTGQMLATEIQSFSIQSRECPTFNEDQTYCDGVFTPRLFYQFQVEQANPIPITAYEAYLLPYTVALAGAYCKKYRIRFKDRVEYNRLLTEIQERPAEYGRMCSDAIVFLLVSPVAYSGNPLTRRYRFTNTLPRFRLSGRGCKYLGIPANTVSVDLGDALYRDEYTQATGLDGTCGFQFMCCFPACTSDVLPPRLLGYISVNDIRIQGTIHGARHALDIPTAKALNDVYEPRHRTGVQETHPKILTSVGIDFEDCDGTPVNGEFTVVLSIE